MRIVRWDDFIKHNHHWPEPCSLSIGNFDGVHRGHQYLLSQLIKSPNKSLAITFNRKPAHSSSNFPGFLFSMQQKLEKLDSLGIWRVIIIDFSEKFSKLTAKEFLSLLLDRLNVRQMILGQNFRLGRDRAWGVDECRNYLNSFGIDAAVQAPLKMDGLHISSTLIRQRIENGELDQAEKMLGHPHLLDLRALPVVRTEDSFSVDSSHVRQVLPPPGNYPVFLFYADQVLTDTLTVRKNKICWTRETKKLIEMIGFTKNKKGVENAISKGTKGANYFRIWQTGQ